MKYLLLEHWTHTREVYPRISIFDTPEARDKATLATIFSDEPDALLGHEEEAESYLRELRETGSVEFEGDPGLSWTACDELVLQNNPDQRRGGQAPAS